MFPRSLIRLALTLFPAGLLGAQATVLKGSLGGQGDVVVYSAPGTAGMRPPELQGIVLMPVDAVGRSPSTQFLPDQPRLKNDVLFGSRILLPQHQGALYRYRKPESTGTQFGYFLVRPNGLASFLAAFPGTGAGGIEDPIPDPVAITSQGDAMLVATTAAAGGNLFEIDLVTGAVHELTSTLPPLQFLSQGMILLPNWGAALTSKGPLRFLRGGSRPLFVPLVPRAARARLGQNPGAPSPLPYIGTGIVGSADGSTVAMIAGVAPEQAHVFTFRLAGPPVCVNDNPALIAHAGFGTEASPMLALSPDGQRAAWKTFVTTTAGDLSGECFSREVTDLPSPHEFQITGDQNFTDTLNDTGVISFFGPNKVRLLVGEANGVGGVEKADIFTATFPLGGGAPTFTNLTNTSGDAAAPFLSKGDIETTDGVFQIPGDLGAVFYVDGPSGQGRVDRLDAATGQVDQIRSGIAQVDFIERAGSSFVMGMLHDSPAQRELLEIPFDHSKPAKSLGTFPSLQVFTSHTGELAGTFAGLLSVTGGQQLVRVQIPSGTAESLSGTFPFGTSLGFDGSGAILASPRDTTRAWFLTWSAGAVAAYGSGPLQSIVLPGN